MEKNNSVNRSIGRGAGARGTSQISNNGKDAYRKSKQSTKGTYRVEFTKMYEGVSEKDIELRKTYGKDLISLNVGVPADMITLRTKKDNSNQTVTALDEVFYVKVGKDNYGKLSIRTQRLRRSNLLIFVFQVKKNAPKPPQKSFSRPRTYNKKSRSQKSQTSRSSWNRRKK